MIGKIIVLILILGTGWITADYYLGISNPIINTVNSVLSTNLSNISITQPLPQININQFTACLNELYSPGTPIRFWTINVTLAEGYMNDCSVSNYRNTPANASSESYLCHLVYRCENYSVETTTTIPNPNLITVETIRSSESSYLGKVVTIQGTITLSNIAQSAPNTIALYDKQGIRISIISQSNFMYQSGAIYNVTGVVSLYNSPPVQNDAGNGYSSWSDIYLNNTSIVKIS